MMRTLFLFLPCISLLVFPAPLSIVALVVAAFVSPVAAFAAGVCADLLYFAPHAAVVPFYSLLGAGIAIIALFVRRFVQTSMMLPT